MEECDDDKYYQVAAILSHVDDTINNNENCPSHTIDMSDVILLRWMVRNLIWQLLMPKSLIILT